uniref:Uncharacterized protein n=1 Tax=Triticum urartu TaxID=4572 RepID=A0A8R7PEG5_TRIUA
PSTSNLSLTGIVCLRHRELDPTCCVLTATTSIIARCTILLCQGNQKHKCFYSNSPPTPRQSPGVTRLLPRTCSPSRASCRRRDHFSRQCAMCGPCSGIALRGVSTQAVQLHHLRSFTSAT